MDGKSNSLEHDPSRLSRTRSIRQLTNASNELGPASISASDALRLPPNQTFGPFVVYQYGNIDQPGAYMADASGVLLWAKEAPGTNQQARRRLPSYAPRSWCSGPLGSGRSSADSTSTWNLGSGDQREVRPQQGDDRGRQQACRICWAVWTTSRAYQPQSQAV